jgi:hypothetical protein
MSATADRTSCLEILSLVADGENWIELRYPTPDGWRRAWARTPEDAAAKARDLQEKGREVFVGLLPRLGTHAPDKTTYCPSGVVWVDADSERAVRKLELFEPQPTAIVLSGGMDGRTAKAHAYWALTERLAVEHVKRAAMRLQHHLDADRNATDCGRILRLPGSVHKSGRPAELASFTGEVHTLRSIVGDLPDAPDFSPPDSPRMAKSTDEWVNTFRGFYREQGNGYDGPGRHDTFRSVAGYLLTKCGGVPPDVLLELVVPWAQAHLENCPARAELERNFDGVLEREREKRKR